MAKGAQAKENVIACMRQAFGDKFIGVVDKKVYVWADDGGETVQIAISLTCPKNNIEAAVPTTSTQESGSGEMISFESETEVEVPKDELQKANDLLKKYNL